MKKYVGAATRSPIKGENMNYLMLIKSFLVGGMICVIGQVLIDKTKITTARILVAYVTIGTILGGFGIYKYLIDFAGCGATVPLTGFGNLLANGAIEASKESGLLGAILGGTKAAAAGISAAIFFGYIASIISKPKIKKQ